MLRIPDFPGFESALSRQQAYVKPLADYETNRYSLDGTTIVHWTSYLKEALDRWSYEPPVIGRSQ